MKILGALTLLAAAIILALPTTSDAIPAFARKYGFNCNMCHTAFVKLNDFGQRFRDNGYQIPGQVGGEKNVFEGGVPPLAVRTMAGYSLTSTDTHGVNSSANSFDVFGFDLLSAGVLHKNVSFLLVYVPRIDEPAATPSGPGDHGSNPSQIASLQSVNVVFSNIVPNLLNLRAGRFEPGYHEISSLRSYYLLQPYEIYGFISPRVDFNFDDTQLGIEATGHSKCGCKYALGVVNGNGGNPDNDKYKDLYVGLSKAFMGGDGQSAGQRIGAFGYFGRQRMIPIGYALAQLPQPEEEPFYRFGGDVSLNWKTLNLQGFFMQGIDSKELNPFADEEYKYSGGFVQLDCAGLWDNRLVASLLYNWITPPDADKDREVKAYTGLVRYYMGDWTAVNVALHAEFTHREFGSEAETKGDEIALVLDFDF